VMKLHDAVVKAVATPAVRDRLTSVGADPQTMSPEEFTRFIRTDIEKWGKLAKAAGIVIER
jgi:tripartite-type tricarboxylate transporter receptor subunit TctC